MNKCEWCGKKLDSKESYQRNNGICDEECFIALRENEKQLRKCR
jgi:hypothetical protein